MKKFIAVLLVLACVLSFAACNKKDKVLTQDEAVAVALADAKLSDYEEAHAHITEQNGVPCFSIHISKDGHTYSYLIAAKGGEILASGVEEGTH